MTMQENYKIKELENESNQLQEQIDSLSHQKNEVDNKLRFQKILESMRNEHSRNINKTKQKNNKSRRK